MHIPTSLTLRILISVILIPLQAVALSGKTLSTFPQGERFGILKLYEGENATVDIIAVHGLDGNRESAWQAANNINWIRDLLPQYAPNSRILTYGYNADTSSSSELSSQFMFNLAETFISDVVGLRQNTNTERRPIIFIAHSLGGLLVRSALIRSDISRDEGKKSVKLSTYGILFFGTPHNGAIGVPLRRLSLAILSIFRSTNDRILRHLEIDSEWLQDQLGQYKNIGSEFVTRFFYETQPTRILPGLRLMLVPYSSAVIPGLSSSDDVGLEADHVSMVKYSGPESINFRRVISSLSPMLSACTEKILGNWALHGQASSKPTIPEARPYSLPLSLPYPRNERFVGRVKELALLEGILHRSHNGKHCTVAVLHGTGGMGKTQIALQFVYQNYENYTAVIWINARSLQEANRDFIATARRIYPDWNKPTQEESFPPLHEKIYSSQTLLEAIQLVKSWLSQPENSNWLIVFDNVDDLESFNLRKEFFPWSSHGSIVITSRRSESKRLGTGSVEVSEIDPISADRLLCSGTGISSITTNEEKAVTELARELRYLPLALDQASSYIDAQQITFEDYLRLYRDNFQLVASQRPTSSVWDYKNTMYTTWSVSLDAISREDASSGTCAGDLFLIMGFLNPQAIDQRIFESPVARKSLGPYQNCSFADSFQLLMSYSLIKRKERGKEFTIHPVVHTWAREALPRENKVLAFVLARNILFFNLLSKDILRGFDLIPRPWEPEVAGLESMMGAMSSTDLKQYFQMQRMTLPHVQTCIDYMSRYGYLPQDDPMNEGLTSALPTLYEYYGFWEQAEHSYTRTVAELSIDHSSGSIEVIESRYNLASMKWRLHRLRDAEHLQVETISLARRSLGDEDVHTLEAMHLLAQIYMSQNNFANAESLLMSVMNGTRYCHNLELGKWPVSVGLDLMVRQDLARISLRRGMLDLAEEQQLQLVQKFSALLGEEHPATLRSLNDLALTYLAEGQSHAAEMILQRVVEDQISSFGNRHPNTLIYMNNLGRALMDQGKLELALKTFHDVLGFWQEFYPDHPAKMLTVYDLSNTYTRMDNLQPVKNVQESSLIPTSTDVSWLEELRRGLQADASVLTPMWSAMTYGWMLIISIVAYQVAVDLFLLLKSSSLPNTIALWLSTWWNGVTTKHSKESHLAVEGKGGSQEYSCSRADLKTYIRYFVEVDSQMCYPILAWGPQCNRENWRSSGTEDFYWGLWAFMPLIFIAFLMGCSEDFAGWGLV